MQSSLHASKFSHVFNGRFKGGYITRQYGMPAQNIHAVQLELSQRIYMEEKLPYRYDPALAKDVQLLIGDLLETCVTWASRHRQKV
jgi:N-formylglutamate amidohydrolase